jgi:hypothetical protein
MAKLTGELGTNATQGAAIQGATPGVGPKLRAADTSASADSARAVLVREPPKTPVRITGQLGTFGTQGTALQGAVAGSAPRLAVVESSASSDVAHASGALYVLAPSIAPTSNVGVPLVLLGNVSTGAIPQRGILSQLAHFFDESQNLIQDACFESGARRAYPGDQVSSPLTAVVNTPTLEGDWSLQIAAGDQCTLLEIPWEPGVPLSVAVDIGYASADASLGILFSNNSLINPIIEGAQSTVTGNDPQTLSISSVAPPLTTTVLVYARCDGAGTAIFDRVIATDSPMPVPFFFGDTGGCTFDGQRTFSTSSRNGTPAFLQDMIESAAPYWSSDSTLVSA